MTDNLQFKLLCKGFDYYISDDAERKDEETLSFNGVVLDAHSLGIESPQAELFQLDLITNKDHELNFRIDKAELNKKRFLWATVLVSEKKLSEIKTMLTYIINEKVEITIGIYGQNPDEKLYKWDFDNSPFSFEIDSHYFGVKFTSDSTLIIPDTI